MFTPLSSLLISALGRKNLVICGALLQNSGVLLFSGVVFMPEYVLLRSYFVYASFIARMFMGIGGVTCKGY
jgi:hypothetical protein